MSNMNRLETIANRQRKSRVRDLAFAALIVFAGAMSLMGVQQAVQAAPSPTSRSARRQSLRQGLRHRRGRRTGLASPSQPFEFHLALSVKKDLTMTTTNRLDFDHRSQPGSGLRDCDLRGRPWRSPPSFAMTTVSTAADAATPAHVAHR